MKDLNEEHRNEIQKLKNEYTKYIKELEDKIKLGSKIDLQIKKRQLTDEQVQEIKRPGRLRDLVILFYGMLFLLVIIFRYFCFNIKFNYFN